MAAFGCSFNAFEAQLRSMSGADDAIVDALLGHTVTETGVEFWCPPVTSGGLDLRPIVL